MALLHCKFFSEALGLSTSMYVILPQETHGQIGLSSRDAQEKHRTLFLLHGLSDDESIWVRRTSIERYAAPLGLAVVMPRVDRSFYTDMAAGLAYWTFVSEELPAIARRFFPLSERREDNYVAGLSMGGYGAFKLALSLPKQFSMAAGLSGAVDVAAAAERLSAESAQSKQAREWSNIFGDLTHVRGGSNDLFFLAETLAQHASPQPKLYQCCGTDDFLYDANLRFRDHLRGLGYELTYNEEEADHEWGYWDREIQRVLAWISKTWEHES
jgi:S-formylglutathione hydrolase FrmB